MLPFVELVDPDGDGSTVLDARKNTETACM